MGALVEEIDEPEQKRGRGRPSLDMRELLFCSIQKVYSQLSSRRAYSLYKNAEDRRQIRKAPHSNAVNKFLNREDITPLLKRLVDVTASPFNSIETEFAVDSSGFRTTGFTEYCKDKHRIKKTHSWVKAHICIGVKTNVITGIEITKENANDNPQFPPLIKRTQENGFDIKEVTADKGYSSKFNLETVDKLGGKAYIPFKRNTRGLSRGSLVWRKMFLYFQYKQDEFLEHYHKRSNVETTFYMIKTKLGDKLRSKKFPAQKNELLCKIIAHNIIVLIHEMYELGIEPDFCIEQ